MRSRARIGSRSSRRGRRQRRAFDLL